jgi:parvulin-like peptidyl-prolyl isomerase
MKASLRLLSPLLLVAALLAGCGGGSKAVPLAPGDVAVVGPTHIVKAQFDTLMHEAQVNLKSQGQAFPKAGTTQYSQIKSQAMTLLVQEAEREAAATKLGLSVTPKEIQTRLVAIEKQYFGGSAVKYQAALKKQGLTDAEVRNNIKSQLISSKLFTALTKDVAVTPAAVSLYYDKHLTSYQTPESREARYILVGKNKSSLAETLYQQLKGAPDSTWCTLAKKYSQDPGSKATCGKPAAPFTKGGTVAEFDKALFSLATNTLAKVNTKQYGWFVLQPTAAITPATKKPFTKEAKSIAKTLLTDKKNTFMTTWAANIQKSYCKGSQIKYQVGYTPSPDPCAPAAATTT